MCGLAGFINYKNNLSANEITALTEALMIESEERGTDATGVAYMDKGRIKIYKSNKPAHRMNFKMPVTPVVMGHTRHSTQGSERKPYNNHPFLGRYNSFALAHNGILFNDETLRRSLKLPKTKVETDSYIAVQLLEQRGEVNFESLKYMAETVSGSFSFTVLDHDGSLYFVKGDSPLAMLHFADLGLYVYASTDEILWKAISETFLLKSIKSALGDKDAVIGTVMLNEGDIMKIDSNGSISKSEFDFDSYISFGLSWRDYHIP